MAGECPGLAVGVGRGLLSRLGRGDRTPQCQSLEHTCLPGGCMAGVLQAPGAVVTMTKSYPEKLRGHLVPGRM